MSRSERKVPLAATNNGGHKVVRWAQTRETERGWIREDNLPVECSTSSRARSLSELGKLILDHVVLSLYVELQVPVLLRPCAGQEPCAKQGETKTRGVRG